MTDTIGSGSDRWRPRAAHFALAAQALGEIVERRKPADAILRELFRTRSEAGSRDRAAISTLVYGVLRDWFPLRAMLGSDVTPLDLAVASALDLAVADLPRLDVNAEGIAVKLAARGGISAAARHNVSEDSWRRLEAQHGADAGALADALNREATVDLRVNTLKATRGQAIAALAQDKLEATPMPQCVTGLRLSRRAALQNSRAFREGWVEPQDEGSQRLVEFFAAKPGEKIADWCAGAGGKTLALGAAMHDKGELWALDTHAARLSRMNPRLSRSGLSIVRYGVLPDARPPHDFDAVLVDAPCSASGTWRRNPELRLAEPDLPALARVQMDILRTAAGHVRPGGRLVYATCSLWSEENGQVTQAFLGTHPGWRLDGELRLLPHRDGTDGFYAARLRAPRGVECAP